MLTVGLVSRQASACRLDLIVMANPYTARTATSDFFHGRIYDLGVMAIVREGSLANWLAAVRRAFADPHCDGTRAL